jgi:hypothetical protein
MEHDDQHREAITRALCVTQKVTTGIFSDKVKRMGDVAVEAGVITIKLDFVASDSDGVFLAEVIALAIQECFKAHPAAFDPYIRRAGV